MVVLSLRFCGDWEGVEWDEVFVGFIGLGVGVVWFIVYNLKSKIMVMLGFYKYIYILKVIFKKILKIFLLNLYFFIIKRLFY